jgi:hypothetical protein
MEDKLFSIEELENIRIIAGHRANMLRGVIKNYENDGKINALKRKKGIEDAEFELGIMINIEAKAMREISKDILNEN